MINSLNNFTPRFYWLSLLLVCLCNANAAEQAVAVVNGVSIPSKLFEHTVQSNVSQGQTETTQLRGAVKEELIARELMVQEANRRGLDKQSEFALYILRQNYLIDQLIQDEIKHNPILESDLRTEYERQSKLLGSVDSKQYQLADIVLENEAEARSVIALIHSGEKFDLLAKAKSLDPSKERGGDVGWLLPDQMTPSISNVVVNLSIGSVTAVPIQVGSYWHVVKLLDKRDFQIPSFDESKGALQTALIQNRRAVLLKKLQETAKIKR